MKTIKTTVPRWFWFITVISLLWNIIGVLSFIGHTFITTKSIQSLSVEEQALYSEYPLWTTIVFAIAVLTGLWGSITLLVRKQICQSIFQISLLAILIQMTHNIFFTKSIEVYGLQQAITMPIIVIIYGVFLIWFSRYSISKNWLT